MRRPPSECRFPAWVLPTALALGVIAVAFASSSGWITGYQRFVIISVAVNVILCASLNLVNGYMGEFSVGHAAFMSLGAYASALITSKWLALMPTPASFAIAIIFGGAIAGFVGFLLGLLSFKTRGDYLAIITLAFLMIVKSAFENIPFVGGPSGMVVRPLTQPAVACAVAILALWIMRNLIYSKYGRAIAAIREDEIAANAMGVRTREAKIVAFATSSFFGGVAGALYAHQVGFIEPSSFGITRSTEILVMVYLGGVASLTGSVLGAVIFTILLQALQGLGTWRWVILPTILVLLMLYRPRGIFGFRELRAFLPRLRPTPRA